MAGEQDKKDQKETIAVSTPLKKAPADDKKDDKKPEELSEEDQALKEGLELAVLRLQDEDDSLHKPALDHLIQEIRSSTSSMTSVPKPLKFLRPHYATLKGIYESWPISHSMKRQMADVMSVLAMTMADHGSREMLKFKLQGNKVENSSWGHEYVRSLAGEISEEYNARLEVSEEDEPFVDDLMVLVDDIVPFQMKHNAEAEAVDLLMEVRQLQKLGALSEEGIVDERNYGRVCLYLIRSANFIADPDDLLVLYETTFALYKKQLKFTDALRVAVKMGNDLHVASLFAEDSGASDVDRKQMALILARHRSHITLEQEDLNAIISNVSLSDQYTAVASAMDLSTPKTPEDIYKTEVCTYIPYYYILSCYTHYYTLHR